MELKLELKDIEWPLEYIDHDRNIARAIVVDNYGYYYFVRAFHDDVPKRHKVALIAEQNLIFCSQFLRDKRFGMEDYYGQ